MNKKVFWILASILITIWQISFLYEFNYLREHLNLVLVFAILLVVISRFENGLIFALFAGLILDLYSPFNFGILTVALLTTTFIINILLRKLITQKSIYSLLIVIIVGTTVYNFIIWSLINIFYWLDWNFLTIAFSTHLVYQIFGQILLHSLVIVIFWILIKSIKRQIKSKFLFSSNP
jgi:rod shape-determining protein MreD